MRTGVPRQTCATHRQYAKATQNRSIVSGGALMRHSCDGEASEADASCPKPVGRAHDAALTWPSPCPKSAVKNVSPIPPSHSSERYSRDNYVTCLSGGRKKKASAQPEVPGSTSGGDRKRDSAWRLRPRTAVGGSNMARTQQLLDKKTMREGRRGGVNKMRVFGKRELSCDSRPKPRFRQPNLGSDY